MSCAELHSECCYTLMLGLKLTKDPGYYFVKSSRLPAPTQPATIVGANIQPDPKPGAGWKSLVKRRLCSRADFEGQILNSAPSRVVFMFNTPAPSLCMCSGGSGRDQGTSYAEILLGGPGKSQKSYFGNTVAEIILRKKLNFIGNK